MKSPKIYICALLLSLLSLAGLNAQTIKDIDGNVYRTVKIGTRTWMAENLKTTKFNDGTPIPLITINEEWQTAATPAYCWYENKSQLHTDYGALYNWFTVNSGKLCPDGWHASSDAEWTELTSLHGIEEVAGGMLKEEGTSHWQDPNEGATNENGFAALPGGHRAFNGAFGDLGEYGYWWSSTGSRPTEAWYRYIGNIGKWVQRLDFGDKRNGYSVRCVLGPAETAKIQDAEEQKIQEPVTIRNEQYRFEVTIPSDWSMRKGIKPDPDEGMKTGQPSFAMDGGDSQGDPKGWNGLATNSPYITIFANEKTDQDPEEFARLFESTITSFRGTVDNMNRSFSVGDAKGFYCNYTLGLKSRFVALYRNGIRVVFYTIQFPQNDTAVYEKNDSEIEKVIQSLRIR